MLAEAGKGRGEGDGEGAAYMQRRELRQPVHLLEALFVGVCDLDGVFMGSSVDAGGSWSQLLKGRGRGGEEEEGGRLTRGGRHI